MRVTRPTIFTVFSTTTPMNSKGNKFATIQEAIDDLGAGGGYVYVPVGTWTEHISITEDYIHLIGHSRATIIQSGTTTHAITISGDYCELENLKILGNGGGGNNFDSVNLSGDYCKIRNCIIGTGDRNGLNIALGTMNWVEGCFFYGSDTNAINITGPNNTICNCYITAVSNGINLTATGDETVVSCVRLHVIGGDGIYIHADAENCLVDSIWCKSVIGTEINDLSGTSTIGDNEIV